ncbi:hypothetical protein [Psychrobacter sp. 230]|jgi:hypothetical protein|uniref:hypothetical protein n=1 Tax=Psychrobacter sp. 230 TaxID=2555884 RepID=UPI001067513D|nr:hypothetical protein [Psychrobacter sp. 230]TEW87149.1 hypothetical protein E2545_06130 [Psychrobacter sp. 230]|tara:strand:+ start:9122 stop:9568 length:447 start_codon:yes stop_codon:yes gene_type:complete
MSLVNLTETATELKRLNDVSSYRQLFCVYEIDLVCANEEGRFSSFYKTEDIWLLDDGEGDTYEDWEDRFTALEEIADGANEVKVNDDEYIKLTVMLVPKFVTACFTHEAATAYIECSKYRLNRPYIETTNLKQNAEMLGIRNFITDTF